MFGQELPTLGQTYLTVQKKISNFNVINMDQTFELTQWIKKIKKHPLN